MPEKNFQTVCVCGAGTMGTGIAQVLAEHGYNTTLYDLQSDMVNQARISIEKNLQKQIEKNKFTEEEKQNVLNRLYFTASIDDCKAELIIEAIIEKYEAKTELLTKLVKLNSDDTIFATNTSSLSVSEIAKNVIHPERVIGVHFFNPAPIMKLVEVVKGSHTSDATIQNILMLVRKIDKTPVICKDAPGFIVNHVARPYYIESLRLVEEGIADFSTIDLLLESIGFKMGPFKLMDLIGNDINFTVSCSVYEQLGKPDRLKPSRIQEEKVKDGELGKKSGKGYYSY
jgi:3-hydroxybutyryl-CoA dehydrogenase